MKEINIAKVIVQKRREKGITQDELASYMGVSKASVSKWETGKSYPDVVFLPQLAAYFNISIDELMGYAPQMTKEDIRKLYHRLSSDFAIKPFESVYGECKKIIKKYYSCYPLLVQMVVLYLNHHMLVEDQKKRETILQEAVDLCVRIKTESEDVWLSKEATSMEALCYLTLRRPLDVIGLFDESIRPIAADDLTMAQAYEMVGNKAMAKKVTQISMYQHLMLLVGTAPFYLMQNADDPKMTEEILNRTLSVAKTYDLEHLHPNSMVQLYLMAAYVYSLQGDTGRTLDMLEKYKDCCIHGFFPYNIHGDAFFDEVGGWFAEFDLGTNAPRDEKIIKESMLQGVLSNPAFSTLAEEPRFNNIVEALRQNLGGKTNGTV